MSISISNGKTGMKRTMEKMFFYYRGLGAIVNRMVDGRVNVFHTGRKTIQLNTISICISYYYSLISR